VREINQYGNILKGRNVEAERGGDKKGRREGAESENKREEDRQY
jgi:hypothetical protein